MEILLNRVKIEERIRAKGVSLEEFCLKCGISVEDFYKFTYSHCGRLKISVFGKIADFTGCRVEDLIIKIPSEK